MHGQAHGQNSTEFGYTIPKELLDAAAVMDGTDDGEIDSVSSIDYLVSRSGLSLKSLVMGGKSLGSFLEKEGFDGLPSENWPKPGNTTYKYYKVGPFIILGTLCDFIQKSMIFRFVDIRSFSSIPYIYYLIFMQTRKTVFCYRFC